MTVLIRVNSILSALPDLFTRLTGISSQVSELRALQNQDANASEARDIGAHQELAALDGKIGKESTDAELRNAAVLDAIRQLRADFAVAAGDLSAQLIRIEKDVATIKAAVHAEDAVGAKIVFGTPIPQ